MEENVVDATKIKKLEIVNTKKNYIFEFVRDSEEETQFKQFCYYPNDKHWCPICCGKFKGDHCPDEGLPTHVPDLIDEDDAFDIFEENQNDREEFRFFINDEEV